MHKNLQLHGLWSIKFLPNQFHLNKGYHGKSSRGRGCLSNCICKREARVQHIVMGKISSIPYPFMPWWYSINNQENHRSAQYRWLLCTTSNYSVHNYYIANYFYSGCWYGMPTVPRHVHISSLHDPTMVDTVMA